MALLCRSGGMVDAPDSKSGELWFVRVRVSPSAPLNDLAKLRVFMVQFDLERLLSIGSISPSSSFLAKEMIKYSKNLPANARILEIGAGRGPITKFLVKELKSSQKLDVVELMPEFCQSLQKYFSNKPLVTIYCCDILEFDIHKKYDLVICSLPFNSMDPEITKRVMALLPSMLNKSGIFSFFEYSFTQKIFYYLLRGKNLERYKKARSLVKNFVKQYEFEHTNIYANIPPAVVRFLRFN